MDDREKVINKVTAIVADMQEEVDEWKDYSDSELRGGLTCDCDWWYKTLQTLKDAIVLLKALDVTPEELERLKKCRHECKIDCLLEHYEKIKAERDALLEKQEPRLMVAKDFEDNPNVDGDGYLPCWIECNEIEVERAIRFGAIQEGETLDGWTEVSKAELLPTDLSYNPNVRHWTARPSEEQRRKTPWPDA